MAVPAGSHCFAASQQLKRYSFACRINTGTTVHWRLFLRPNMEVV
jgi:hypothetical protein